MKLQDCFKNIIGFTENDCPCFDQKPEGWNESLSGFYIDDMEYGIPLQSVSASSDCGEGSVWSLMERARQKAIRNFLTDFTVAMEATNTKAFQGFNGPFANHKESFNRTMTGLDQFAGVRYVPIRYKGVQMTIREICVYFDNSNPVDVELYSSEDSAVIEAWTITPVAGRKTCFTLPNAVTLPLSKNGQPIEYYFVYDSTGNKPKNIKYTCGCGAGQNPTLYNYLDGYGFSINDMNDLQDVTEKSQYVNGIQPVGTISCDSTSWLCDNWDYWSDPFARVMANTIQWYAITILAGSILNSGRINFYTLLHKESLLGRISSLRKKIGENMTYLVANIPKGASDCMRCDHSRYQKKTISV